MAFVAVLDQERADMLLKISRIRRTGSLSHCRKQQGEKNLTERLDGVVTFFFSREWSLKRINPLWKGIILPIRAFSDN